MLALRLSPTTCGIGSSRRLTGEVPIARGTRPVFGGGEDSVPHLDRYGIAVSVEIFAQDEPEGDSPPHRVIFCTLLKRWGR